MDHWIGRSINMGSSGDDLMNLGPFIQSYVFNSQPDKPRIPFMPRLESIENDNNVPASGLPMRATRSRAMMPVSIQQPKVVLERIDQEEGSVPVKSNNLPLKKRHWEARKSIDKLPWISKKPKLLNEKQARIKRWLLANFVYCPRHRNAKVSSRLVLNRAIQKFGPMTQKALGYIMYHAFPGVERVKDTRRGHIFKGILDKKDLSVRYKAMELEEKDRDEPLEELEKDGGPPSCEKSDDSEDPLYDPPIPCTQSNTFRRETRGVTRKDTEHFQPVNRHELVETTSNGNGHVQQNGVVDSQQGLERIKRESSDQGYDSNNSENENRKKACQDESGISHRSSFSNEDENCLSDESIKIKKERSDPEYEPLSSTDEGDDMFSPGSPNIDTNAFMFHNPLTFPLLRRTLDASPIAAAAVASVHSPLHRRVSSPVYMMPACQSAMLKINDMHQASPPLLCGMAQQSIHPPQLQYQVNEQVALRSVPQQPQVTFHSARFQAQNPAVNKMPQSLHEAQAQVSYLLAYIQMREKKFSELEKHFGDVSNEFRKLSHSFKQFQTERAPFLDPMNPSDQGT
ncbi:uncharacterized protein LOC135496173 [Lineus longissimus]|uniref:uncharacterized protein LOC135496173 n=1 Tax=Lineus longissimus TaxID=88925 RepID=UPI00315D95B0